MKAVDNNDINAICPTKYYSSHTHNEAIHINNDELLRMKKLIHELKTCALYSG